MNTREQALLSLISGDGMTANYSEGVLVGYRYYDAKNQEPLFPFGYGLPIRRSRYGESAGGARRGRAGHGQSARHEQRNREGAESGFSCISEARQLRKNRQNS